MAETGLIVVRPRLGRIGVRREAQHVGTKEWREIVPLTELPDGSIECHLGHFEDMPDGANTRLIFEEMP